MTSPSTAEFLISPDRCKTGVWWHWILGSVDEEGIRGDLVINIFYSLNRWD